MPAALLLHMRNKGADKLRINRAADQCSCFRYIASKIPLLPKSEVLVAIQCGLCQTWSEIPDRFSQDATQMTFTLDFYTGL